MDGASRGRRAVHDGAVKREIGQIRDGLLIVCPARYQSFGTVCSGSDLTTTTNGGSSRDSGPKAQRAAREMIGM